MEQEQANRAQTTTTARRNYKLYNVPTEAVKNFKPSTRTPIKVALASPKPRKLNINMEKLDVEVIRDVCNLYLMGVFPDCGISGYLRLPTMEFYECTRINVLAMKTLRRGSLSSVPFDASKVLFETNEVFCGPMCF
jgi:hypothetical protein